MFDFFSDRNLNTLKPLSDMVSINAKVLETVAQKQTTLYTDLLQDSVQYVKGLSEQSDLAGVVDTNKSFAEKTQEKLILAAKDMYAIVTDSQQEAGSLMKDTLTTINEPAPKKTKAKATVAA